MRRRWVDGAPRLGFQAPVEKRVAPAEVEVDHCARARAAEQVPTCDQEQSVDVARDIGVGIVKLDDGVKATARIVDCELDKLAVGQRVRIEFRKLQEDGESGIPRYGCKFAPAPA